MQRLAQLKSGELKQTDPLNQTEQIKRLQIVEGLTEFPTEIFELADSLEILDLSNNQLSSLPSDFGRLHKLKIVFLSDNRFTELPDVLADCPHLEMVGFKANQIHTVSETALPPKLRWLILTDNQLQKLPNSIGQHSYLQKLMLAGNQLTELPKTLQNCENLALLRISANRLIELPEWLLSMPKLAWLAFSGNAFNPINSLESVDNNDALHQVSLEDIEILELLGEGASGLIHKAKWINRPEGHECSDEHIAVKLFKGCVTSDGYPVDELQACVTAGKHQNLVEMTAQIDQADQLALVMKLIPERFENLGLPPTLETCTRDTFKEGMQLSVIEIVKIALSVADTLEHLHDKGICHGDLYAHNILIDKTCDVLIGDFGATSHYEMLSELQRQALQGIEVRAFSYLLDDLLSLCSDSTSYADGFEKLTCLKQRCLDAAPEQWLDFLSIKEQLLLL
ncbi:MAG: hypothetical protein ISEC1_P0199 [Thiomicrorhabdus sp.]|nr:MAG: hypothetical protein ISEC1_P0199 [Thiomicrorhabdus sp.]